MKILQRNFDFIYNENNLEVIVRYKIKASKGITNENIEDLRSKIHKGIDKYWNNSRFVVVKENEVWKTELPITFKVIEVDEDFHTIIKLRKKIIVSRNREYVFVNVNLKPSSSERDIAHEFGHVFGLKDEYQPNSLWEKFVGTKLWIDKTFYYDKKALMNRGSELRPRYFEQFAQALNDFFPDSKYRIREIMSV